MDTNDHLEVLPDDFALFLLTGDANPICTPAGLKLMGDLSRKATPRRWAALWRTHERALREFATAHGIARPGDDFYGARLADEVDRADAAAHRADVARANDAAHHR